MFCVSCYVMRFGLGRGLTVGCAQVDEDILKAEELVMLFGMRGKFKQMGDTGLMRARERVDAVIEKYSKREHEEKAGHSGKI